MEEVDAAVDEVIESLIQDALEKLANLTREEGYKSSELTFLRQQSERFIKLYQENGIIESLTHQVMYNSEVAHYFCMSLKSLHELWDSKTMQETFAEALRRGDSLLVDGISFLRGYRDNRIIQEAIATCIAEHEHFMFHLHITTAAGLSEHPSIKKAILSRKHDIIKSLNAHWHESSLITWAPYLMQDEDIRQTILGFKPNIIKDLREVESLVDVTVLIERVKWIRNDPDIMKEVNDRIVNRRGSCRTSLARAAKTSDILHQYPALVNAMENWYGKGESFYL